MGEKEPVRYNLGKILRFKAKYLRQLLFEGKKTTIRKGIVTPKTPAVYLESDGKIYGEATIKGVRFTKLSELTDEDALRDGFESRKELVKALQEIYPELSEDDWVTIISFSDVTRYSSPVTREALREARRHEKDFARIARLALAYGLVETFEEQRILASLQVTGDVKKTAKELGTSPRYIKLILGKIIKRLKERGLMK